jgi:hypothetical protein
MGLVVLPLAVGFTASQTACHTPAPSGESAGPTAPRNGPTAASTKDVPVSDTDANPRGAATKVAAAPASNAVSARAEATQAFFDRDGATCVQSLRAAQAKEQLPTGLARAAEQGMLGRCLMLAGQCQEGKRHVRESNELIMRDLGPSHQRAAVDADVGTYCGDGATEPRDRMLVSCAEVERANLKEDPAWCMRAYEKLKVASAKFASDPSVDSALRDRAARDRTLVVMCLNTPATCDDAARLYQEIQRADGREPIAQAFDAIAPRCAGRIPAATPPPRASSSAPTHSPRKATPQSGKSPDLVSPF